MASPSSGDRRALRCLTNILYACKQIAIQQSAYMLSAGTERGGRWGEEEESWRGCVAAQGFPATQVSADVSRRV